MSATNAAVIKALTILDHLSARSSGQRLTDIALALDLPESTTQRLLASLAAKDYVKQNPVDLTYGLGWRLATMARAFDRETWLTENIRPHLQQLAREVNRSINLAVFQNNRVIPLDCLVPERSALPLYTWPGNTFPAHATALGKTLLACLDEREAEIVLPQLALETYTSTTITCLEDLRQELETVRRRGYSVNHGEFVPEERCVAAPIRDAGGTTVAAISITGRVSQMPAELEIEMGTAIAAAAQRISQALFGASQAQAMAPDEVPLEMGESASE